MSELGSLGFQLLPLLLQQQSWSCDHQNETHPLSMTAGSHEQPGRVRFTTVNCHPGEWTEGLGWLGGKPCMRGRPWLETNSSQWPQHKWCYPLLILSVLLDHRTTEKKVGLAILSVATSPGDNIEVVYAEVDGHVNSPEQRNPLKPRQKRPTTIDWRMRLVESPKQHTDCVTP
jgi:hypothetical protein